MEHTFYWKTALSVQDLKIIVWISSAAKKNKGLHSRGVTKINLNIYI